MLIRKNQRLKKRNSESCIVYEYSFRNKDIGFAIAKIRGRYPDSGFVMNKVCNEMCYVLNRKGRIVIENKEFRIKEGDIVLIEVKKKYYIEGNLDLIIPTAPAWHPEQHRLVE